MLEISLSHIPGPYGDVSLCLFVSLSGPAWSTMKGSRTISAPPEGSPEGMDLSLVGLPPPVSQRPSSASATKSIVRSVSVVTGSEPRKRALVSVGARPFWGGIWSLVPHKSICVISMVILLTGRTGPHKPSELPWGRPSSSSSVVGSCLSYSTAFRFSESVDLWEGDKLLWPCRNWVGDRWAGTGALGTATFPSPVPVGRGPGCLSLRDP